MITQLSRDIKIVGEVIHKGYDRKTCWVHARCAFMPAKGPGGSDDIVVTMQKSFMGTSGDVFDVFGALSMMRGSLGGCTWTEIEEQAAFAPIVRSESVSEVVSDFTAQWHEGQGVLLGIGHTATYKNGRIHPVPRPRETSYSIYDREAGVWGPVQFLQMPDEERFFSAGAGCTQWVEKEDGEILVPIYFRTPSADQYTSAVLRCRFVGGRLELQEIGDELTLPAVRGFVEPSLIECAGRYWLSLRHDERGYLVVSEDGLHFEAPCPLRFDDGSDLGSYNTQQHWLKLGDRLFLVYTREGLDNDHVVRHRAPLMMAEVDQARRCIIRASERIVVPNRGAQLGNFGVTQRTNNEAWVCVSEWMENAGAWNEPVWSALERKYPEADLPALEATPGRCGLCELSGSDNSIYIVKVTEG